MQHRTVRAVIGTGRRLRAGVSLVMALAMVVGLTAMVAPAPAAAAPCSPAALPGDQTIQVDGASVPLYLPANYAGERLPLVLDLHGSSSNGLAELAGDGIRAVADTNRFAVIAPNGAVPFSASPQFSGWAWNIPGVPLVGTVVYPPAGTRDDVQFLSHAIDAAAARACIDLKRVYATGVSGGGRMASQLACDLSERIAAIAPISGVRFPLASDTPPHTVDCSPSRAVPVLAIHGVWDPINVFADTPPPEAATLPATIAAPVAGSSWTYSAETAVARWGAHNGCKPEPRVSAVTTNIDEVAYRACHDNADVVLFKVKNNGHLSPGHGGSVPVSFVNPTNDEVDGTVVAWNFLARYHL